ncbi:kinase-like domain-containing protein [Helicostylum pulchrum]|nr:kinase-like domain-containing protein [Helicostylum pulchrum]
MDEAPSSPRLSHNSKSTTSLTHTTGGSEPTLSTEVDDPSHPLYHHRRIVSDFDYGDILGEGSYSTVLIGKDKRTGKQYAVKRLDKAHIVKNNKVKYVMIERDALSRMNHPGIVKLYWTYKDNRSLYFVLDLARSGELYTYVRRLAPFDLETAKFYAAEILLAIEHIHERGVIHRDIKPENILLDDSMHIKVTDFGSAKIIDENNQQEGEDTAGTRSFVGTAEYVSPELLRSDRVSKEADMWAFGCVIYQMLSGKSPFKAPTDYLIFQKIKNLEYVMPDEFPSAAKDIIQKLLTSDPEQRFGSQTLGGIQAMKDHPFFDGVDWENIFNLTAPPLKERLEEEAKKHPIVQPKFDFDGVEDDEDDEDIWFHNNRGNSQKDPFRDRTPVVHESISPLSSADVSPLDPVKHEELAADSPELNPTSSFLNRASVLQREESTKGMSQLSSVASSVQSIPERIGPHPTW